MFHSKYLIPIALLISHICGATCDYYSSIYGLEILLEAEEYLLESLKDFIETKQDYEEEIMKILGEIKKEHGKAKNDTLFCLSNPICAFKLIKRFVVDWTLVEEHVNNDPNAEDLVLDLTRFMNGSFVSPTEDDLTGAAMGLVRLMETYRLNVSDLAQGKLLGTNYGYEMTTSDCVELGLSLYQAEEYRPSLFWLLEAMVRLNRSTSTSKETKLHVLQYLSAVYFYLDDSKMAFRINNEILAIDQTNIDALENKEIYEQKAFQQRNSRRVSRQFCTKRREPSVQEMYEMTCRGERHQTPTEKRPLQCMYATNGKPYRLIAPFKLEQLNLDPIILHYHDVITERHIKEIIKNAGPKFERSKVGDVDSWVSQVRTSKSAWLYYEDHEFLKAIANTLNDITGLSLSTAEALQVANYGIGGHYGPHFDFSEDPIQSYGEWRGNRIATVVIYLNDVELGGATAFPFLKLAVPALKRSLVFWYNLHESSEPDFRTKHAGCPVLKGSKCIMTEWYHEVGQEFIRPCGLEQQGDISKHYDLID